MFTGRLAILASVVAVGLAKDPLIGAKMCDFVVANGFSCDQHAVTTEDGYILGVFRIKNEGRPPIFLQHGFVDASTTWVMNDADQSLAYLAYSAGFDVWMGNSRGNSYSLNATFCTDCASSAKFWDFTFDDMAKYDVPAVIEYVLSETNATKLTWVGHSQGTTQMFAALSRDPSLAAKLNSFVALAPVAYITSPGGHLLGPLSKLSDSLLSKLGKVFPPEDDWIDKIMPGYCKIMPSVCANVLFALVGGGESHQLNKTRLPIYLSHTPATTSVKDLIHWAQLIRSKKFDMFDYGSPDANRQAYGQPEPPLYPLNSISSVPVAFFSGGLDYMADPTDVAQLEREVPALDIALKLDFPNLNHMDFVWGMNVTELVYSPLLEFATSKAFF